MRILVTGGCGFIGSHFVKRLVAAGEEVVVLDKLTYAGNPRNLEDTGVEVVEGDIADAELVARVADGCEAVVNFAAETHVDRSILAAAEFIQTDVYGTFVLLEHAKSDRRAPGARVDRRGLRRRAARQIVAGGRPASPLEPVLRVEGGRRSPGARLRADVRRGCARHPRLEHVRHVPVPGEDDSALRHERARRQPLPLYGDGRQTRDWLHVRDHCAAVEVVLRGGAAGEIYNVGGGCELENADVASRILDLTGADPELLRHVDDRPGHDRRYSLDSSKLVALGWQPERDFDVGLTETIDWYRERRDWWEPLKSGEYLDYYRRQYADRLNG